MMSDLIVPVQGSRPVLFGTDIEPRLVVERFNEGVSIIDLADEFRISVDLVEAAIRNHTREHAASLKKVRWNAARANKEGWHKIAIRNLAKHGLVADDVKKWINENTNGMHMMHVVEWDRYLAIAFSDKMDAMACLLRFPEPQWLGKFRSNLRNDPSYEEGRRVKKALKKV